MLDHVSITVNDLDRSQAFYDAVMAVLSVPCVYRDADMLGYGTRNRGGDDGHTYLTVRRSSGDAAADNRHWAFRAPDRAAVDAFHAAGLANGGSCNGPPGLRLNYHPSYYAAFLIDPCGNRIEAVTHQP